MAWQKNVTETLTGTADIVTAGSLTDLMFLVILSNSLNSGAIAGRLRLNLDSGTNYAYRASDNGGADFTATSDTAGLNSTGNASYPTFSVGYIINIATEEKLCIFFGVGQGTAGAGNAPTRRESVTKHAQTSNPVTDYSDVNTGAGDYAIDSNVSVLGTD